MHRDGTFDRHLLAVASAVGMVAIVALPLTVTLSGDLGRILASVLAFATPATLVAAGQLRSRSWMVRLGVISAAVLLPLLVLNVLGQLPLLSIVVGPIIAGIAVGGPLRDTDTVAAAGFLGGGTIAVIGGFAAIPAGRAALVGVVLIAGVTGLAVTIHRLRPPTRA